MPLRAPAVMLSSYGLTPFQYVPSPHASHPSCLASHRRNYAQHAAAASEDDADSHWPEPVLPHTTPTPYQILGCKRGEVYAKHRFYSLVKLYHPDRDHPSSSVAKLPPSVRLERYRLVVNAHTILSDESKRRAYDVWGHGWSGSNPVPPHFHAPHAASKRTQWPAGQDPMYNATWEDWERWYQRRHGYPDPNPRGTYLSSLAFMSLVFGIVSLGGVLQGTRANIVTASAVDRYEKINQEASRELARSKHATMAGDRSERIRTFVEHREASNMGEEAYQRLLPPSEPCDPDSVRKR